MPDTICTIMSHLPQQSSALKLLEHTILSLVNALEYYISPPSPVWLVLILHFPDFYSNPGLYAPAPAPTLTSSTFQCPKLKHFMAITSHSSIHSSLFPLRCKLLESRPLSCVTSSHHRKY